MTNFFQGEVDLLPANCEVVTSSWNFRARPGLLEDEPPDSEDDPIYLSEFVAS